MKNVIKVLILSFVVSASCSQKAERKPNIIFIMLDDLGKEWVSTYGTDDIQTPTIDKLAHEGMQFSNLTLCPIEPKLLISL